MRQAVKHTFLLASVLGFNAGACFAAQTAAWPEFKELNLDAARAMAVPAVTALDAGELKAYTAAGPKYTFALPVTNPSGLNAAISAADKAGDMTVAVTRKSYGMYEASMKMGGGTVSFGIFRITSGGYLVRSGDVNITAIPAASGDYYDVSGYIPSPSTTTIKIKLAIGAGRTLGVAEQGYKLSLGAARVTGEITPRIFSKAEAACMVALGMAMHADDLAQPDPAWTPYAPGPWVHQPGHGFNNPWYQYASGTYGGGGAGGRAAGKKKSAGASGGGNSSGGGYGRGGGGRGGGRRKSAARGGGGRGQEAGGSRRGGRQAGYDGAEGGGRGGRQRSSGGAGQAGSAARARAKAAAAAGRGGAGAPGRKKAPGPGGANNGRRYIQTGRAGDGVKPGPARGTGITGLGGPKFHDVNNSKPAAAKAVTAAKNSGKQPPQYRDSLNDLTRQGPQRIWGVGPGKWRAHCPPPPLRDALNDAPARRAAAAAPAAESSGGRGLAGVVDALGLVLGDWRDAITMLWSWLKGTLFTI
jgi:hypothetical protein